MKHSLIILASVALLGFSERSFGQNSTTATGYAGGNFIAPINLTLVQPLNFGVIISGSTSGWVRITNNGGVSYGGNGGVSGYVHQIYGAQGPAIWDVTGAAGFKFDFSHPTNITKVGSWPSGMSISINDLYGLNPYTLSAGDNYYNVGGTLSLPADTPPGAYSATWEQTVMYN
jgi:hypothetical protein